MGSTDTFIRLLKRIPIDIGQECMNEKTKGKEIAFNLVTTVRNKTALDVGCRKGIQTKRLIERGYEVTSIDIEKEYIDCRIVDVNNKLPFNNNTFDLIWCSEVIEHLKDPAKTIKEFNRILKDNGEMILTTPNSYFILQRIMSVVGLTPQRVQRNDHFHFFSFKMIRSLFPNCTFYGYFPYFLVRFKIRKLIGILSPTFVIHYKM